MKEFIQTKTLTKQQINSKERAIYDAILQNSKFIETGNFTAIHPVDLEHLFNLYDDLYFENQLKEQIGNIPLKFRCSNRMTRAGAKTEMYGTQLPFGQNVVHKFGITVSTKLLFDTFEEGDRPITVTGILCKDRLQALQKLFEHELIHLVELLVWKKSQCSAKRFQSIANRFFGHTQHTHQLITPHERAWTDHQLRPGDRVQFQYKGESLTGFINRITVRASVLVQDRKGRLFSDGKRYLTYYIPLKNLQRI